MLKKVKFVLFHNKEIGMPALNFTSDSGKNPNYELIKLLKKHNLTQNFSSECMLTVVDPSDRIVSSCEGVGDCEKCCFHKKIAKFLGIKMISTILKCNYGSLTK